MGKASDKVGGERKKMCVTEKTGIITGRQSSVSDCRVIELLLKLNCIAR